MSNLPGAAINIPTNTVEAGSQTESGSSGIEKSVEAAIATGNMPALVQAGTQLTQSTTQSISAIAAADPNEALLPEQGVISAIAGQASGLAQEAHRAYINSISEILKAAPQAEPIAEPVVVEEPLVQVPPQAPAASMPGFEARPAPPQEPAPLAPPTIEIQPIAIAAQMYLDEREATEKILNASQPNYEGHSIRTAVPYYEAVLAQDPSDEQWQHFVAALKLESLYYETTLKRADLALKINKLQNEIEDNRKRNILPTSEQAEQLKQWQQAFDQANSEVKELAIKKEQAEEEYHATQ